MDLKQIEYFIHVAERGSFSKAALALSVAQPALSRQIRALETELRETLLIRNGRGVQLTESGKRLLAHGHDILQRIAQAREDIGVNRHEPVGNIAIAMPPSLARSLILPLVQAFRVEMPQARLAIMDGFSAHITEWLAAGRIDVGLAYDPEPLPVIHIQPLFQEEICLISPARAAPRHSITLDELAAYPLLMPQRGHTFRKLMESAAALAGVQLNVVWEVSSMPAILDLVAAGHGHAALGEYALHALPTNLALQLTRFRKPIVSTLCLVTPSTKRATVLMDRTAALLQRLALGIAGARSS